MEIVIKVYFFEKGNLSNFNATVDKENAKKARGRLEFECKKIIDYLKELNEDGTIKSIFRPKNKDIQDELDKLVIAKKSLKESIEKIKLIL